MAKARATQSATPAAMADYVPEGLPDTGVVETDAPNRPQEATAAADAAIAPSGGNTMLPAEPLQPLTELVGEARGTVLIELPPVVPLTEIEQSGYFPDHVDFRLRGGSSTAPNERLAMKQLVKSLKARQARLKGDREPLVLTSADAMRWLLQQVAGAFEEATCDKIET